MSHFYDLLQQHICTDNPWRTFGKEPFRIGDKLVACDGAVLVCITCDEPAKSVGEVAANESQAKEIVKVGVLPPATPFRVTRKALSAWAGAAFDACACGGKAPECTDCHGATVSSHTCTCGDKHERECPTCEGKGVICPHCKGDGKVRSQSAGYFEPTEQVIDRRLLAKALLVLEHVDHLQVYSEKKTDLTTPLVLGVPEAYIMVHQLRWMDRVEKLPTFVNEWLEKTE